MIVLRVLRTQTLRVMARANLIAFRTIRSTIQMRPFVFNIGRWRGAAGGERYDVAGVLVIILHFFTVYLIDPISNRNETNQIKSNYDITLFTHELHFTIHL